ncbi:transient receptor potential channel pyrexia [Contarinia nasturtii]|uniref:transient receptor potential channel pyrexia n=1 Tax=Contarinia nasturtii TaxID=265458 RepID=UPI0012D4338A|nr:transient receptor potential channel pyrexia [Contarinia nasturtii]
MDSVRLSVIESSMCHTHNCDILNDTKDEILMVDNDNELDCVDDEDDDKRSISSESTCCGNIKTETLKHLNNAQQQSCDFEIWRLFQVDDHNMKDIPNSDAILNILASTDLDGEDFVIAPDDVNNALLVSILMGRRNFVQRFLNDFNADVNCMDNKGRSALHLACSTGNVCIVKLLINRGALVNRWDHAMKITPLHCACNACSVECVKCLINNKAHVNAGIEKRSALHIAVEKNSITCVEFLLKNGANPNTPQVYTETPLHTAAALGNIQCMKLLLAYGADVRSQFGKKRMTALHLAAQDDYTDCVKMLLEHGANVNAKNVDGKTPLHLACLSQCAETVEILIANGADVNETYSDGRTALHAAIVKESKCLECTRNLLLADADVNRADNYGYTPLHIAALNESSACAFLLIEHGADITARTGGGITALSFIVRRTPEVIPKFLSKFDASIKVNEHEIGDVDCEIKMDFRLLVPNPKHGETDLMLAFIEVGKKRILKHPLCETFLFLKWHRIRKFFLFSLLYHALFVMLFSILIIGVYEKECPGNHAIFGYSAEPETEKDCEAPYYVKPVGYIVIIMNFLLLAKEFFQMAHGFMLYVKYWENWVQMLIILGVFVCATPATVREDDLKKVPDGQYHVAAIVIFLVWLELMMIVGRFPIFGLYVQMFTKVAVNFAKFLLAYCCLLIAFGLSFGVLFNSYPAFKSIYWTMLKTITMMSGELEFEDIFYAKDYPIQFPVTSHLMFFAFVVLVTIILTNLLVGLAVSDIQALQESAGLDRLTRQVELIARLESLFFSKLFRSAPPKIIRMCQQSALLRASRYHLQFSFRPNDPRDRRLPKELAFNIYKLVAERRDRNVSIKRRKREQNIAYFADTLNKQCGEPFIRNHWAKDRVRMKSQRRPNSVNTNQPQTIECISSNFIEIDKKVCAIITQINELTNKLDNIQSISSKKIDDISKEIGILKVNTQTHYK